MIKSFKWNEVDGQIYDLEYADEITETEPGVYTHVFTPPNWTLQDVVALLSRLPYKKPPTGRGQAELGEGLD